MLKGFFLFLAFICKASIWKSLKQHHPTITKYVIAPVRQLFLGFLGRDQPVDLQDVQEVNAMLPTEVNLQVLCVNMNK